MGKFRYFYYFIKSIFEDIWEAATKRLPFRSKACRILGHRYKGKRIDDESNPDVELWTADTDAGCVYCDHKQRSMFK